MLSQPIEADTKKTFVTSCYLVSNTLRTVWRTPTCNFCNMTNILSGEVPRLALAHFAANAKVQTPKGRRRGTGRLYRPLAGTGRRRPVCYRESCQGP